MTKHKAQSTKHKHKSMRIGFYQFKPVFGKVEKNLKKVISALKDVDADLIVLPELPFTGYYFKDRPELITLAEEPDNSGLR